MNHLISITKSDGTKQLFEEEKLVNSLKRSGASESLVDDIVSEVEADMYDGMKTEEIYRRAFDLLRKHSYHAAVKYSVRRAVFDLGPDGFPFEKFVSKVFNAWGYEAVTDQILTGTCVEHEMDVVAWKNDDLSMAEVKFHNEFGLKCDLKVVLYVKARFDDLSDNIFEYGGQARKVTGRWLFTNTKFSESAIQYGECKGLKMIGWNYPRSNSLHEIIANHNLHPITAIPSLSKQNRTDLIARNFLLCSDIAKNPNILEEIGLSQDILARVIEEVRSFSSVTGQNTPVGSVA